MPTPEMYLNQSFDEHRVPLKLRVPAVEMFYVTDRAIAAPSFSNSKSIDKTTFRYGTERSSSLAFGRVTAKFRNKKNDWAALLAASSVAKRKKSFKYRLDSVEELGRLPASPYQFVRTDNGIEIAPEVALQRSEQINKFQHHLEKRLSQTHFKDVILYVHGFDNTFDEAVFTMAGLWHFLERQGVPIIYSWPAGGGGLTGYFTDRESGEFTEYHLKETFRMLAAMPEIKNIHVISHSRGSDVTTTALRELVIEHRAAGIDPRKSLKVKNLVLAAPDLDFGVMQQRLMAEHFGPAIGQITIYTSPQDKALRLSQFLMSGLRFGRVTAGDVGMNESDVFATAGNVDFIQVPKNTRFAGHDYFHSDPAVSADLIRLITTNAKPGSSVRKLQSMGDHFWKINSSSQGRR